ncbi:hypothetical protein VNO77_33390 [Canavalia gladiata]|uniref:Uncharacterized protein n=1 Tax=Canavalia gladiata TaxID=3824 RepID=A0AAN9KCB8_CANGL
MFFAPFSSSNFLFLRCPTPQSHLETNSPNMKPAIHYFTDPLSAPSSTVENGRAATPLSLVSCTHQLAEATKHNIRLWINL